MTFHLEHKKPPANLHTCTIIVHLYLPINNLTEKQSKPCAIEPWGIELPH